MFFSHAVNIKAFISEYTVDPLPPSQVPISQLLYSKFDAFAIFCRRSDWFLYCIWHLHG